MIERRMGGPSKAAHKSLEDYFAVVSTGLNSLRLFGKRAIHPFLDAEPVPEEFWPEVWRTISSNPRRGKGVAYLHIPVCENHCHLCGFYQNRWSGEDGGRHADVLIDELQHGREQNSPNRVGACAQR